DGAGFDVASQLGVGDLVVVAPKGRGVVRRVRNAEEEIRVAKPATVKEGRLIDRVGAGLHRGNGLGGLPAHLGTTLLALTPRDDHGVEALGPELLQISLLMLFAALANHVELRIVAVRALDQAGEGGTVKLGEMLAGEESDEVRRAVDRLAVDQLHGLTGSPA